MRTTRLTGYIALIMAMAPAVALMPQDFKLLTTRDLVKLCSVDEDDLLYHSGKAFCLGYLDAVWDYHEALIQGPEFSRIVCPGPDVTREQAVDVLLEWAASEAKMLDADAPAQGVMRAFAAKWPCTDE